MNAKKQFKSQPKSKNKNRNRNNKILNSESQLNKYTNFINIFYLKIYHYQNYFFIYNLNIKTSKKNININDIILKKLRENPKTTKNNFFNKNMSKHIKAKDIKPNTSKSPIIVRCNSNINKVKKTIKDNETKIISKKFGKININKNIFSKNVRNINKILSQRMKKILNDKTLREKLVSKFTQFFIIKKIKLKENN